MTEEWTSTTSFLVVSREDLDPEEISGRLELEPTISLAPDKSRPFKNGAGLWSISADTRTESTDAQLESLCSSTLAIRDRLESLREEGHTIELIVVGHVSGIHQIPIAPTTLRSLQRLNLPVAFTTRRAASEEDLFWAEFDMHS
ncbi:DUF4279 domain-containing protein [Nocardia cyriacigeorgica]|uniref:DUF4279 domain-containing protein n=1 Tax=Nocardia cyriacigeorgica TaxID=135487 RepID=UPI0024570E11|nr:DUF4279 domain-containing protein [Nocardia cyriacigeorgica]